MLRESKKSDSKFSIEIKKNIMDKWKILSKEKVADFRVFDIYREKLLLTQKHSEHEFYIMEAPDWVNVIPITADKKVVLIKQYRAGIDDITIEIPGGVIDSDDVSPVVAAGRELEEESGYLSPNLSLLGYVNPNPAFLTNKCYIVLAENVEPKGKTNFDPAEYIETYTVPLTDINNMISTGEIRHALTVAAFSMLRASRPDLF